jgi:hypothetical protein
MITDMRRIAVASIILFRLPAASFRRFDYCDKFKADISNIYLVAVSVE